MYSVRTAGRFWRVSARTLGASSRSSASLPAFRRLHRIRRAEDEKIGDGAERRELLDRLVGRPVLAEADRIVGHDEDDAVAHQRREPDRRAGNSR